MKKLFTSSILILATATMAAAAPPSISGKWKIHNDISGNESDQECTFVQSDKTLTGTCKGENGDLKVTGTVDGKKISFKYDSEYNGSALTLTYTGSLNDSGKIKGDVQVDPYGVSGEFEATPAGLDPPPSTPQK